MKKFTSFLLLILLSIICYSQHNVLQGTYTTFDSRVIEVYQIEGEFCVLNIDTSIISEEQLSDTTTLSKIVQRTDQYYGFYKDNLGYEPSGGNSNFDYKVNVFFGTPSCGSGCGLIGTKGIEVSAFENIFYTLKYDLNVNRDNIIGYEFGRNFFDISSKILLPFEDGTDEKNGGFAEGFASMMYYYALDSILTNESQRMLNQVFLDVKWNLKKYRSYINEDWANPENSFHHWTKLEIIDPNRGMSGRNAPIFTGHNILFGIFEEFGRENLLPSFMTIIKNRPNVKTVEDALSNIAYATSFSLNQNLVPYFENVLKFSLNDDVKNDINSLPSIDNRLIKDESLLWFVTPFDSITLNIKSINYLSDDCTYRIVIDGKTYTENADGRNNLTYDILEGENEKVITCELINLDNQMIDSYNILLKKRHGIKIFDYKDDIFAYYLGNAKIKSYFVGDTLVAISVEKDSLANYVIRHNIILAEDRTYKIEGNIRNIRNSYDIENPIISGLPSSGWSVFGMQTSTHGEGSKRIGYDTGKNDTLSFYGVNEEFNSNSFFADDIEYVLARIHFSGIGYGLKSEYTDFWFYDITDTDNDGFIDFEDDCPSEFGTNNGCPQNTNVEQLESKDLFVYPNPANHKLYIETPVSGNLMIHDVTGKLILMKEIESNKNEIDISELVSGTYLLRFTSNESTETLKFIKN